jgi:hypothetical protein
MGRNGGWVRAGKYGMTGYARTMRMTCDRGNWKSWTRQ